MNGAEVSPVPLLTQQPQMIAFQSCTITWHQDCSLKISTNSATPSAAATPKHKFMLINLNLNFPVGELLLVCRKLGSGKMFLLLYNILFNLPYDEERYQKTLEPRKLLEANSESSSTIAPVSEVKAEKKKPRKLIEEEKRAVGRIGRDIWETYIRACGNVWYWIVFGVVLIIGSISPVFENGWLRHWSSVGDEDNNPIFYIAIYAAITAAGLIIGTVRYFVLYNGSIRASTVLYKRLLETVLFANIRFHDTVSRGRLLNRFGKDFEAAKVYGQTSRDMRRLDSVTRSPLYSIYGETISGVAILRAFGASSKFLRDMLCCVDTNANPYYWMWGVNRWLSTRFNLLSCGVIGVTGLVSLLTPGISASLAGFALTFASTITNDLLFMVLRFVGPEQLQLSELTSIPSSSRSHLSSLNLDHLRHGLPKEPLSVQDLVIRYAPELPDVLHNLNFSIRPGEKVCYACNPGLYPADVLA
ncbi:hypothetical protein C0995_013396 [Termitomyces sp. Mi166|nr:hypothetical protein C0995_013396 [Termitomyces sp. Mi166\